MSIFAHCKEGITPFCFLCMLITCFLTQNVNQGLCIRNTLNVFGSVDRIACHVYFSTLVVDIMHFFSFMMAVSTKKFVRQEWKSFASSLTILTQEERYALGILEALCIRLHIFYASSFTWTCWPHPKTEVTVIFFITVELDIFLEKKSYWWLNINYKMGSII
jgi:hypothetical protein